MTEEASVDAGEALEPQEPNGYPDEGVESDSIDYEENDDIGGDVQAVEQDATHQTPPGKRAREVDDDGTVGEDAHGNSP